MPKSKYTEDFKKEVAEATRKWNVVKSGKKI